MKAINIYVELQKTSVKTGLAPIVIRFDSGGKHLVSDPLHHKVPPEYWDLAAKEVKGDYPFAVFLNSIINSRLSSHRDFLFRRQAFNLSVDKTILSQYLKAKDGFASFYTHAEMILNNKLTEDGQELADDTKRRYRDELKRLQKFQPELSFGQITSEWLLEYKSWMQNSYSKRDGKRMHKNGIWKALSVIRMFYNESVRRKIILADNNPFDNFKVGSFETDMEKIKWLELHEINRLEDVLLNLPMEDITKRVGWRFLAMCTTGMRISDAMNLDDMLFDASGDLKFKPHKTRRHNNTAHIPITSNRQRRYFQMTLNNPLPQTNPKNFRTTFNIQLKILMALAGITTHITSHCGRHTMGSFLVDAGVETKSAMKILGVKSEKVVQTYLHLKEDKLRLEALKLNKIFS